MRLFLATALSISLLGACDVPYPEGAFEPKEEPPGGDDSDDEDDDDFGDPEPGSEDARVITRPDSGRPKPDAGPVTPRDSGGPVPPSDDLAALAGRYLMRIDNYSTATTTSTPQLRVKNRISALLLADLEVDGDTLVAQETACDLMFDHQCDNSNCVDFKTQVASSVVSMFMGPAFRAASRTYTLGAGNELRGGESTLSLGFNEAEGMSAMPTSIADGRLWKVQGGAGIYAETSVTAKAGSIQRTVTCQLSTAQRVKTSFAKQLSSLSPDALKGVTFSAKIDGTQNELLQVGPSSTTQCTARNFDPGNAMQGPVTVRLMPYNGEGCPSRSAWERDFPPSPRFM